MYKILFLTLFIAIKCFSACEPYDFVFGTLTGNYSDIQNQCNKKIHNYKGYLYLDGELKNANGICYEPGGGGSSCTGFCFLKTRCGLADLDSINCARNPSGEGCPQPLDTVCVNIPLSIGAQIGTSARSYYEKSPDGSLKKILNDGNAETLCRNSIDVGMGDITVISDLVGPNGENYGTFCKGSCESVGQSGGGAVTCSGIGCHESFNQSGSINPNDYGGGSGDFGAGTGGGFGSGGGSGSGSGGFVGDSLAPDTSETSNSWASGCNVLNLQTCTCDGFTYVGSSGNSATVYNNKTGQTGVCGLDFTPEVSSCPVDWTTCNFKKNPNDTAIYNVDSMRVDSSGDWEYNYFPILGEINASIKALDYNQNSNAKDMQNFFNNYKGTSFDGSSKRDTTIINITTKDTTILNLPDETIDFDFIYDSIAKWNSNINDLKDTLSSFPFFGSDTPSVEFDTSGSVARIISTASTLIDSGQIAFPFDLQSFAGQSNCPAFMMQGREIKTYVGSSHSFNFSSVCDVRIFGKELFALVRAALRLLVSISCAWVVFKASVNFWGV